jgi:hypothetical protein
MGTSFSYQKIKNNKSFLLYTKPVAPFNTNKIWISQIHLFPEIEKRSIHKNLNIAKTHISENLIAKPSLENKRTGIRCLSKIINLLPILKIFI